MPDTFRAPFRPPFRIALARFNPRLAEPEANAARLAALRAEAAAEGADLLLTPAHSLSGAVPATLAADPAFAVACEAALARLAAASGPAMTAGTPAREGDRLHDAVHLLADGALRARRTAHHPRPGFDPGPVPGPFALGPLRMGLMPGADWRDPAVSETLAETGADLLVALDSLPFETGGQERVLQAAIARVVENGLPLILLNRLGAEGEGAHDGAVLVLDADRTPALRTPPFAAGLTITEWHPDGEGWRCARAPSAPVPEEPALLWQALLLALRDHAARHAPSPILLPLEADAASALTALLAADAFPAGAIRAVLLDPRAAPVAEGLGLKAETPDLAPALRALAAVLPGSAPTALRRLVADALAGAATPLVTGPSASPAAFFPLRHIPLATRRALAEWRAIHRPPGALGPESPTLPAFPEPAPDPPMPGTPWQNLARADYKRRLLPPGLNIAPRAFGHPDQASRETETP